MAQQNKIKPMKNIRYGNADGFSKRNNMFVFSSDINMWISASSSKGRVRAMRQKAKTLKE